MSSGSVPQIFDKTRRLARARRALVLQSRDDAAHYVIDDMIEDVLERVDFMRLPEGQASIVGDMTGVLASALAERGIKASVVDGMSHHEEHPWPFPSQDYIFALGTLDTLNDLPGALLHYRNALNDGGLFMAQIMGAGSIPALRKIVLAADGDRPAARIHPQIDNRAATALLERAGFSRQVVDSRTVTVRFSSLQRLVGDLREQALTAVLTDRAPTLTRAAYTRAVEAFDKLREEDGKVTETFEILTLTGWR